MKKSKKEKPSKKPKKILNERVPTDIDNFDNLIEGGFEKNSINLVVGGAGSGKSIFAMQFLIGGMKRGEHCLYVTFEEKKEQFFKHMLKFGFNLEEYEKKGLFTFLEDAPIKIKTMLESGGGSIESIVLEKKISRIVIDSITSFDLLFEDEPSKREAALSLFDMLSNWNCTTILTLEEEITEGNKISSQALEFESDSIIIFYFTRNKNERERYLEILKMRGTKHSNKIFEFNINKTGISINKKPSHNFPNI